MRPLLSRLLFVSTVVAVATFCGIVLELKELMTMEQAGRTLAISIALAVGSHACCRALDWMDAGKPAVDPYEPQEWEE